MSSKKEIDNFFNNTLKDELLETLQVLRDCNICPRECGTNKFFLNSGYCAGRASFNIASICKHQGEEPVISGSKGICNIFFSGCNLQCVYCQNFQISSNKRDSSQYIKDIKEIIFSIINLLDEGCHAVGFVSPSHNIPQMIIIINLLKRMGRNPVFVMNTNAYDKVDTIIKLENLIDVFLPDFKYMDDILAKELSDVSDYSETAGNAIKEMYRQKGKHLKINGRGEAESGLIIRHLVLPSFVENSIAVLRYIAKEISTDVHISLMSQYNPTTNISSHQDIKRKLNREEYDRIVEEMHILGFENGWVQDLDSAENYNPDFNKEEPFY